MSTSSTTDDLARGTINGADELRVQLIRPSDMPAVVRITWPSQPTMCDTRRFPEAAATLRDCLPLRQPSSPESKRREDRRMDANIELLTRWIDAEGAKRIVVEAGIIEHEMPVPEFSIARRDRETDLYGLLYEIGMRWPAGVATLQQWRLAALVSMSTAATESVK